MLPSIEINSIYLVALPIILGLILIETLISNILNLNVYKKADTFATIGLLTGNIIVSFLIKGTTLAFHIFLYQFKIFEVSAFAPLWFQWLITFVLIDFVFYFYHRCSHRSRFLWAIHMSHHSSEEMNFAVSFRQAWLGPISKIPFFMILPIVGLDPMMIAVAGVLSTLWGIFGHTQVINKLGLLEWVFNTPSHHRVHHGSNIQYIDKNYGNLLIIWDRLFGTFEPEIETVKYGLVKNVNTFNPVKITFMGWQEIFSDIKDSNSFKEVLYNFFGPPNINKKNT
jgi:sterol desaturase/sphingolipid hydroxylase (fatty acid hydroxylase superfamily)